MTMITPSYLGETIEYSSLHACRSTLEDPTDLIITLNAGAETLLARKRELSAEQIARQIEIKDNLDFQGTPCVAVDAREPALRGAEMALAAMTAPSANGASSPLARPATGRR